MEGKYCYSWDGEHYHGEFDTEQEAIEDAKKDKPFAESVYIGTCTEPELKWHSNEEIIIESMQECLLDDVGEYAECFDVSSEDEILLGKMIDEVVATWIEERNIKPNCYAVLDGHRVNLN